MLRHLTLPLFLVLSHSVYACDLCAVYSSERATGEITQQISTDTAANMTKAPLPLRGGVVEQFTSFGTIRDGGSQVSNNSGQYLNSSVTQVYLAYQFKALSVQVSVPAISRTYQRPNGFSTEQGSESGIGDSTILGQWIAYRDSTFSWNIFGGIKLPTGSAARLAEELNETDGPEGTPQSAIHGHDLALGSGSWDVITGTSGQAHFKRYVLPASLQYALRGQGSYGYQYANDFTWQMVPGYYLLLQHTYSGILGLSISGEIKGNDTFRGTTTDDTGISAIYVGPQFSVTMGEKFSGMIGVDLPVLENETSYQIVPTSRIKALISAQL